MRIWLVAGFALVGALTAGLVYLFVIDASGTVIRERATEFAAGRTLRLADDLADSGTDVRMRVAAAEGDGARIWYFDSTGGLIAPENAEFPSGSIYLEALDTALGGGRTTTEAEPAEVVVVGIPAVDPDGGIGALVGRYARPALFENSLDEIRAEALRAAILAMLIGTVAGLGIASLITVRLKRLAAQADQLAAGDFEVGLPIAGRDEIGDLARSLDSMRLSLKESFGVLTADRDKLTAIFDGLNDAVIVIDEEGPVRFYNSAATDLLSVDGAPPPSVTAAVRRATREGFAAHPALRIGDRAWALQARALPDEGAVVVVLRDRTEEMRKEFAERDFVSNAAHELRNPLAGISGAIEVLRSGAKDDPEAREHFLDRLAEDADRMTRLTQSLLTLARVEALGSGEIGVVDLEAAIEDVAAAVEPPPGIEFETDVTSGLTATADPTLIRQVVIGLVTNAFKNTPAPGQVTVRAAEVGPGEVLIEVSDTGSGIPQAEIDRVFERFYRRPESRAQEGFGLGLAIARRMTDVMGGEMGASSVEGEGSTFWVRLPLAEQSGTPVA
jgi:signal transduction histidine kinase/HAMP domain-containing protein